MCQYHHRSSLLFVVAVFWFAAPSAIGSTQGDVDRNGLVTIGDAVLALQVAGGARPAIQPDVVDGDVDGDFAVGVALHPAFQRNRETTCST